MMRDFVYSGTWPNCCMRQGVSSVFAISLSSTPLEVFKSTFVPLNPKKMKWNTPIYSSVALDRHGTRDVVAWWLRRRTFMPELVGSIPAQVRPHSNTLRQCMNPWLLRDCAESGSIGAQDVQHLEIRWRFNGVLSPGGNVRLVKSC